MKLIGCEWFKLKYLSTSLDQYLADREKVKSIGSTIIVQFPDRYQIEASEAMNKYRKAIFELNRTNSTAEYIAKNKKIVDTFSFYCTISQPNFNDTQVMSEISTKALRILTTVRSTRLVNGLQINYNKKSGMHILEKVGVQDIGGKPKTNFLEKLILST